MTIPNPATADRLVLSQELQALVLEYWYEVDMHHGRQAHLFYTEDAVFETSLKRRQGRDAIREFYAGREQRGPRVSLHLVHNFRTVPQADGTAAINYVLALHAADGAPVLPSRPAIMLADARETAVRTADGWRFSSRTLRPLFRDDTPTTG
ncbi:hypothetical protein FOZ76_13070 [Verticiella sediminum]|uniref:SnoaL-like domain-containing protein n=1 Tax=Verticiella sediminum TaxID=1247510 RepID=A0A556ALR3_9BURK|nr:nuclear transport factor 2 family protein [Verticiella sediminum]TSH93817.1 hypothetical protein FOZ76_13070 [Verticiella sediminum]